MSPASHTPLFTRQWTNAFNQPLTFDTSSVRDMYSMFYVRSTPAHATHSPVGPTLRVTWATAPTRSRLLARLPPSQHAFLGARQDTIHPYLSVFNQPLNFNTSSFTNMDHMLYVRSASAHATHSPVGPMLPRPPPPRPPASWPDVSPSQHASLWTR